MFILVLSMLMLSSTLIAYAEDGNISVDVESTDFKGGSGTYKGGVTYARTGYLCYLVEANGGGLIDGMTAKAFKCDGYSALGGEQWRLKAKKGDYGKELRDWNGTAPWEYPCFNEDKTSNAESIKAWMKEPFGDTSRGEEFVYNNWGSTIGDKFSNGEYVLVLENILSFQPCVGRQITAKEIYDGTYPLHVDFKVVLNGDSKHPYSFGRYLHMKSSINTAQVRRMYEDYNARHPNNRLSTSDSVIKGKTQQLNSRFEALANNEVNKIINDPESKIKEANGSPVVGTLAQCINFEREVGGDPGIFSSYTNKIACFSEYIGQGKAGEKAGYKPWTRATDSKISDSDVWNYGVGMLVIKAKDDATIKTYWEPNGSPGKPEPAKPNKTGTCAIVKGYYEENETTGVKTSLGVFCEKDTTNNIQIMDEPGFELVRWDISTVYNDALDPTDWNPPSSLRDGKNPETVKLETPEKVVYVLLKRTLEEEEEAPAEVNYTLSQSTITRQIHISTPDNQLTMPKIQDHEFIWKLLGHVVKCSGHRCDGHEVTKSGSHDSDCPSDCTSSHSYTDTEYHDNVYCSNWTWFDDKLVFSLKNEQKENFPDVLATKGGWENVTSLKGLVLWVQPFTRTIPEETLKGYKNLDYACVLLRGKDKLTVAEWKNTDLNASAANSDLREVSSAGFCIGNTLMGSRKTADYKDNFTVSIVDNSVDNTTKYGATKDAQASCGQTWSATHTNTIKGIQIEKFDIPVSVQLDVYSGSPDKGINDTTCATGRQNHKVSGFNKSNGIEVQYNGTIDFLPYVQMNYDTYTEKYRTAYVLGEHKRSITQNAYADISWNETAGENLRLSSLQWSTHKSATDKWGSGNVLPGGAALTLSIPSSDRQKIVLTTYQVILEGSGKTQVENTGGSVGEFTRDKAIELHQAYVDSVVKGYESLCVEQWVNTNTTNPAWNGGKAVHEQDDISFISSGLHASGDSKYYFRKDGEQGGISAGEGDLDVEDHGISLTDTYTFFTNTYGEVRYIKNNVNPNIGNEKTGELASGGGMADFLNKRTHIVDKLTAAVEQGTGQDKPYGIDGMRSKTGVNWYNESFDGVTIIVQQSTITVGFKQPGERTSILDPRLCKPSSGQSGMFKDGSYSSSQYKCKDHTEAYGIKDKVGTFMNVDVYTENMDMLYKSKIFYIPNVNTQDLH